MLRARTSRTSKVTLVSDQMIFFRSVLIPEAKILIAFSFFSFFPFFSFFFPFFSFFFPLVARQICFRPDTTILAEVRLVPAIASCASLIQRAIQQNDLPFLIRELRERISNAQKRQQEFSEISLKFSPDVQIVFSSSSPRAVIKLEQGAEIELLVHDEYPKTNPPLRVSAVRFGSNAQQSAMIADNLQSAINNGDIKTVTQLVQLAPKFF